MKNGIVKDNENEDNSGGEEEKKFHKRKKSRGEVHPRQMKSE
jgi:hypothetical protein